MAVPKRRKSSSKRDMRRAHHDKITAPTLVPCPNCSSPMVPHRVCPSCGMYKGRRVVEPSQSQDSNE
ncbi:MAG: 50S ribosomal protein L32 [Polyangiaceae bacterium]|nr:50S ribosomal protein L32 [Polyangiaceae bacterium]